VGFPFDHVRVVRIDTRIDPDEGARRLERSLQDGGAARVRRESLTVTFANGFSGGRRGISVVNADAGKFDVRPGPTGLSVGCELSFRRHVLVSFLVAFIFTLIVFAWQQRSFPVLLIMLAGTWVFFAAANYVTTVSELPVFVRQSLTRGE
jgi:hypothetical protein